MPNILDRAKGSLTVMVIFICKKNLFQVRELAVQIFQNMENKCKGPEVVSAYGIQETIGSSGQME